MENSKEIKVEDSDTLENKGVTFSDNRDSDDSESSEDDLRDDPDEEDEERKKKRRKRIKAIVSKSYIRVGDKYLKRVEKPDKTGRAQILWTERQKTTITDDFGRVALHYIPKYEGFVSVPSHVSYKQVYNGFFNEYHALGHKPKKGDFSTISGLLIHLFDGHIDFALDYLQLLYMKPTQRLPIILLESKERGTGKSTFGTLLSLIFEKNSVKLGNADFESDFNSIWVKSLCVIVDETSLDKKGIMQTLKRLSTETGQVSYNEKQKAQTLVDFFGKFVFMSNDEGTALPIERGENRFAVFKVKTFAEKGIIENPNIEKAIQDEIPSFLHFLQNRVMKHQEEGRMYFAHEVYVTEQLLSYYEGSGSHTARAIRSFVSDAFSMFPEEETLRYSIADLIMQLKTGDYAKSIGRVIVRNALEQDMSMKESEKGRYTMYNLIAAESRQGENTEISYTSQFNNRYFEFRREDFQRSK